ncbi:hypothetical protein ACTIVE_6255 [Actinomadura verrucosospora]|uniref:Uncharacterized protein n=1 Tax=Actinomadura verrucosospora TaxID=46165 RepID=A0A7D3ZZV5_ACTVE|nr:hypothetical protein ACTIVE_6255 [Actinomadura verrucosospora]
MSARWRLGGSETDRHAPASRGTEVGLDADRMAQDDTESITLIRQFRTFNPWVVGSSPTRPTTPDQGKHENALLCPLPRMPRFVPLLARCWLGGSIRASKHLARVREAVPLGPHKLGHIARSNRQPSRPERATAACLAECAAGGGVAAAEAAACAV